MTANQKILFSERSSWTCRFGPTNQYFVETPIGVISFLACPRGIHSLDLGGTNVDNASDKVELISQLYPDNGYTYKAAKDTITWLGLYFQNPSLSSEGKPFICVTGKLGSMTDRVWSFLKDNLGPGRVLSYHALASSVGNPGAVRAVGTAMACNPVPLIIPCHRIIRSDGSIGRYCGGKKNDLKLWLLKHEGAIE